MKSYITGRAIIIFGLIFLIAGCAAQAPYLKMDPSLAKDTRVFNDISYVPLARLCDVYGIDCKWDSFMRTAVLVKNGRIILRAGSDRILLNDAEKRL